jgi:hypothetical protein
VFNRNHSGCEPFASTHPSYDHRRESVREISAELDKSRAANQ